MYIAIISSTQELPDLEKLYKFDPSIPIIFFNLRLDVLVRNAKNLLSNLMFFLLLGFLLSEC